jgi:hypothetical protein
LNELAKDEEMTLQMENDTNMLVISASNKNNRKRHGDNDNSDSEKVVETKKKKLTRKEKIKLEKVLERKEKSSRVSRIPFWSIIFVP